MRRGPRCMPGHAARRLLPLGEGAAATESKPSCGQSGRARRGRAFRLLSPPPASSRAVVAPAGLEAQGRVLGSLTAPGRAARGGLIPALSAWSGEVPPARSAGPAALARRGAAPSVSSGRSALGGPAESLSPLCAPSVPSRRFSRQKPCKNLPLT